MNFLELCQRVRQESGISGDGPLTVVNQTGILAKVVEWVRQADLDIKRQRNDWKFLWKLIDGTFTAATKQFSLIDIGLQPGDKIKEISIGGRVLRLIGWECYKDRGYWAADAALVSNQRTPECYAVRPDGAIVVWPIPDKDYTVSIEASKSVEPMLANSDISEIPAAHHDVILQKALMYYASHEEDNSLYQVANARYENAIVLLSSESLPAVTIGRGAFF